MSIHPNRAFGTTVYLQAGDDLSLVPDSHRDMLSDSIVEAFADPCECFSRIAQRTTIENLGTYLKNFVSAGDWTLLLAETFMMDRSTKAAFAWSHPQQYPCMFGLPVGRCCDERLSVLYNDFSFVHWDAIGFSGGLEEVTGLISVEKYGVPSNNPMFPAQASTAVGASGCGDLLVCNQSGEAGFLSHSSGQSYKIGTYAEMINWVFGELLEGRTPEFDHRRV